MNPIKRQALAGASLNRLNDLYGNTPLLNIEYYYSIKKCYGKTKKCVPACSYRSTIARIACGCAAITTQ